MLKSPIPQVNAYCILVTVLFHLFVYLFLIILMKFIFLKNGHVGNDSRSNHNIQQTNRTDMQSFVAYLGPNKILSFSNF